MSTTDRKTDLIAAPAVQDTGAIRLGGAFRLLPVKDVAAEVADHGRIRLGGAFRLARA